MKINYILLYVLSLNNNNTCGRTFRYHKFTFIRPHFLLSVLSRLHFPLAIFFTIAIKRIFRNTNYSIIL